MVDIAADSDVDLNVLLWFALASRCIGVHFCHLAVAIFILVGIAGPWNGEVGRRARQELGVLSAENFLDQRQRVSGNSELSVTYGARENGGFLACHENVYVAMIFLRWAGDGARNVYKNLAELPVQLVAHPIIDSCEHARSIGRVGIRAESRAAHLQGNNGMKPERREFCEMPDQLNLNAVLYWA